MYYKHYTLSEIMIDESVSEAESKSDKATSLFSFVFTFTSEILPNAIASWVVKEQLGAPYVNQLQSVVR